MKSNVTLSLIFMLIFQVLSNASDLSVADRISLRSYPSIFQAWNPIDEPDEFPLNSLKDRLYAAAKHDVLWEEPISQKGFGTPLILESVWDHQHPGLAGNFTKDSLKKALSNRKMLLQLNPSMVFLMEIRFRDAPGSFLPKDSQWWRRNAEGKRASGWKGGPEPYYILDYHNKEFQRNIARQSRYAVESGVYDGIMIDRMEECPIDLLRLIRTAIGDSALIIANSTNQYNGWKAPLMNGVFFEGGNRTPWKDIIRHYQQSCRQPQLFCSSWWGDRDDLQKMKLGLIQTLLFVNSAAYLYTDTNDNAFPDHIHDWYDIWDVKLGKIKGKTIIREDGLHLRPFERGICVYNPENSQPVRVSFEKPYSRASDKSIGHAFTVRPGDGDLFIREK